MPNWTINTVTMDGIGTCEELYTVSPTTGVKYFDFNKLVPEPKSEEECLKKYGEKYIDNGNHSLQHTEEDKWFNWYGWHCDFWGTKWGACDTCIIDDNMVEFSTAWSEPSPIWEALSRKFPSKEIEVVAEYEEGFVTESTYYKGKRVSYSEKEFDYEAM